MNLLVLDISTFTPQGLRKLAQGVTVTLIGKKGECISEPLLFGAD